MGLLLNLDAIACRVMGSHADWQALRENPFRAHVGMRREKSLRP